MIDIIVVQPDCSSGAILKGKIVCTVVMKNVGNSGDINDTVAIM